MEEKYLTLTKEILSKFLNPITNPAFLIGSQATGNAQRFSDIDIAIEGSRLNSAVYFELMNEFEESKIPYLIDIVQL